MDNKGASQATGLSQVEPVSRLDPTGFDPSRFEALAVRCETSRDGDMVELLEEAFSLCFQKPARIWVTDNSGDWTLEYADYHERSWRFSEIMEAGAFVDAAREFLAPHTLWAVGSMEEGPFARLCWPMPGGSYVGGYVEGRGRGVALSLAAAALRGHAIAMEARQGGNEVPSRSDDSAGPKDIAPEQSS